MNLPNKLTLARICLVPAVIAVIMLGGIIPEHIAYPAAALLFGIVALTDMLDGKIARSRGLVTDFGKFLDPLADKMLVTGTMMAILYKFEAIRPYFFWAVLLIIFRDFIVTGIRLIAVSAPSGQVIAANTPGKIKTVTQMICIPVVLLEPTLQMLIGGTVSEDIYPLSFVTTLVTSVFTVLSGAVYLYQSRHLLKDR